MSFENNTLEAIISITTNVPALLDWAGLIIKEHPFLSGVLSGIAANTITSPLEKIRKDLNHSRRVARERKGDGPRHRQ